MNIFKKILDAMSGEKQSESSMVENNYKGTSVSFNGDFYFTEAKINGGALPYPEAGEYYLATNSSNLELGEAVLNALNNGKWCADLESSRICHEEARAKHIERLDAKLKKCGYKSKTALFANMIQCGIHVENNLMTISPLKHDQLEHSTGDLRDGFVDVVIPANSPPEEVGKAVRIALSRCLNPYGEKKGLPKHNFDEYIK